MILLSELNNLNLDCLSHEWVQSVCDSEFFEFGELPLEYANSTDSNEIRSVFRNIMLAFDDWMHSEGNSGEDVSWAILSHQVKHQNLLALLGYYIDYGNKNILSSEYRNNALWASRLYYKLLSVPGHKAYHIYHSQLFAHSLACLSYPKTVCENEDNFFNTKQLTREVNSIIKELSEFAYDLKNVVGKLQLAPNDMNFEDILSNLVDITGGAIVNKLNIDKIELNNLSRVVYEVIDFLLCNSNGESSPLAIKLLFKALLPKLLAASLDYKQANNIVRASYVTYSGLILTKYGKNALSSYVVLLQHLAYSLEGLEKAEVRQTRISLVAGLMSLLPKRSYSNIVKWLLKLSSTTKIPHRQISTELLAHLLSNDPEESTDSGNESRKTSMEDNAEGLEGNIEQQSFDGEKGKGNHSKDNTDDESGPSPSTSQENQELEALDEDISGLLNQRRHCVPHADIVRAIYERVNDVSSTLRSRALVLLTDFLESNHAPVNEAMKELSGDGEHCRIAAVGARCTSDERAAVRKAAAVLVHRLLARNPHPSHYATLVSLCRDASIIVRTAAVNALADVALNSPSEQSLNAFLAGPMHQLSDPEAKIQEQVVNLVQSILITPLQKFDANATADSLPWLFLEGITRLNMRKHLQKACTLLVKSGNCINHRLVDIVSTHLGALNDARDVQSLVLLTSVARHVEYTEVSFLLEYYYKLADDTEIRDSRLMPLTIELISLWSRYASDTERNTLREHLISRLASSSENECRPACASLAASLNPSDLQWATDLMKLSERHALEEGLMEGGAEGGMEGGAGGVEEWVRAADLSLVALEPPSTALLNLFLNALQNPPAGWNDSQRGACVAGLGRICLRSRPGAALAAPKLALLLRDSSAPLCARINALLALTDFCTRYTSIVEPLLGSMCDCLGAAAPAELRRAAARALTRLLLAGFLRLRTPLYYRYCALLADEDSEVREPAEYYVTCCLTVDVIYHHFVDCVLHFNKEHGHKMSFDARQLIYDVMLQRMSLVQRLNTQCRLGREVLHHAAEVADAAADAATEAAAAAAVAAAADADAAADFDADAADLPAPLAAALLDAIGVLCGPRMKLPKKVEKAGDADIDDLQERVTTNIVSHKMKRTVAEVLVPGVLRLYARLRPRGGQLAAYVVRLATDLCSDYRQEIEELIQDDEELVKRVRHFQETIGLEPLAGNARNLVTSSAPPDPDTPRAPRKRPPRAHAHSPRKRALKI